ncbi:CTL-like protein 2 [Drosophila guanche]|uniref:Choline transporter-like protein n=1 Tax=Drosophila guanche TaxID=7266 RepID=A0A3B0JE03_DROGU|nr:CTL-like protein 2 [Drosophila guanche]XP_034126510.1 CTL-like protein 2 [Drosophila guanche]XP_034126511.1 CTL-like protein 2 [Drosophila guanche]SPP80594.1 blast:CTL-like protein 2 [Drosophila guanche]
MTESEELMNKYGEPLRYDRNFKGPRQRDRSCTDVPCLLLFALFLAGWGFIAHYAITHGDLNKLMVPTDSFNQKCGIDSSVLHKKHLFFFNLEQCIDPLVPITGCPTPQVCVESCPTQTFIWDTMHDSLSYEELRSRLICLTDEHKANIRSKSDMQRAIDQNLCARWYIKSAPFLNRCIFEFSPQMCEFIPSFLLKGGRSRRQLMLMPGNATSEPELQAQAMALSMSQALVLPQSNGRLEPVQEEPAVQCRRRLNDAVIKEKMKQTDTRLAKMVGNLVAHFYNGTHDAQRLGEEIVEDLVNSWSIVLVACFCTLIASLVFIALMRWLSAPILWFSIFAVLTGLLVAIYYTVRQYIFWEKTPTVPIHGLNLQSTVKNVLQNQSTWLYLSIFVGVCFVVILLLVIVLRKRIRIAIALTKEGSKAVSSVFSTVFFPIFSWVLFIATIAFAIGVGLYLGSIGELSFRMVQRLNEAGQVTNEPCVCEGPAINYTLGSACDPQLFEKHCYNKQASTTGFFQQSQRVACSQTTCSFLDIDNPPLVRWAIFYNIFGFLWLSFFISAFSDMVLAATFASWYWTFKKRDVPYFTLARAFGQTAFYHLGTLAFGSLILAVVRLIRLVLEYINEKLKKYDNAVTRAILCCMRCFFWLLETFLKFLNRNAYIMCAIHGKNFCTSAKDAFNLIMRNFLRVITLDQVTDFLFFISKLLLTAGAGVATYYFLANNPAIVQLHYRAVPTTVVVIAAFLITSVFFGVYSTAVDTLFLCFLEDCERNDGTPEKPFFMSKQLMKILGKKNKLPPRQRRSK